MVAFKDCYVRVSTDGTNWTDLSDSATVEQPTGSGLRPISTLNPYGADVPTLVPGRRPPVQLIVTYNYTDATIDNTIRQAYENASAFYVGFAPRGNTNGNFLYTSAAGLVVTPPIPEGERHSGTVVLNRFTFETSGLTKSVIGIT